MNVYYHVVPTWMLLYSIYAANWLILIQLRSIFDSTEQCIQTWHKVEVLKIDYQDLDIIHHNKFNENIGFANQDWYYEVEEEWAGRIRFGSRLSQGSC